MILPRHSSLRPANPSQLDWFPFNICLLQEYGESELGISEAAVMMQTIAKSGGGMTAASLIHIDIFGLEPVAKFGSKEQKQC